MVFWSDHDVNETAGSKRLGPHSASGPLTVRPAALAWGTLPVPGCVGHAIVGYVAVGYVLPIIGYVPYLSLDGSIFGYCV